MAGSIRDAMATYWDDDCESGDTVQSAWAQDVNATLDDKVKLTPPSDQTITGANTFFGDSNGFGFADVYFTRAAANIITLQDNDALRIPETGGVLYFGTDVSLSRGAADRLDLATGDSLNIVSGSIKIATNTVIDSSRNVDANGLTIATCVNAGTDTDKFLVLDASNNVDFRTGTEVWADMGLTASATEVNQALDGISGNVTDTNLNTLTGAGQTTLHYHKQDSFHLYLNNWETSVGSPTAPTDPASDDAEWFWWLDNGDRIRYKDHLGMPRLGGTTMYITMTIYINNNADTHTLTFKAVEWTTTASTTTLTGDSDTGLAKGQYHRLTLGGITVVAGRWYRPMIEWTASGTQPDVTIFSTTLHFA